jgi:hypothetical protein
MAEFDYHQFLLDKWGDPDRLVAFLRGYGEIVPRATVNQWFRRRSIPTEYFGKLVAFLKVDGGEAAANVEDYLK